MPIYEYVCKACGNELEEMQRITDSPLRKCPSCGALKLQRIVSRTSFQLKGDGWFTSGGYGYKGGKDKSASNTASTSDKSGAKKKTANSASNTKHAAA